jgi:UDP-N-acetylmuramoyl-tripeptide--D-alanyl-D-alanine ligase
MTTTWLATTMAEFGYEVLPGPDRPIAGGSADSRTLEPGQLFAAFRGETMDGNLFTVEALRAGAAAVIAERHPGAATGDATVVIVDDTRTAVARMGRAWRRHCGTLVTGITGTVGKTTAKELIASTLSRWHRTHRSPGNLNSREGLPLALCSLTGEHDISVLELAMDSPGEIVELCEICEPVVGVVLNIGLTHVSKLGSVDAIAREKLSLARWLPPDGTAVLNVDDPRIAEAVPSIRARVITFGQAGTAALQASDVHDDGLDGVSFRLRHGGRCVQARTPLPGVHVLPAALAATGVALALGHSLAEAADAVAVADAPGRMVVRHATKGATILDDRYNASPASMAGALELLRGRPGRRIALLGRMAELGDYETGEHQRIGTLTASCTDVVLAVGEPCRALIDSAVAAGHRDAHWFADKDEAARLATSLLGPGCTLLLKASRSQAFETLLPVLLGVDA